MKKYIQKTLTIVLALGITIALVPMLAAFEAHIINVTAQIDNTCLNFIGDIAFGTVFPQEKLDKTFDVELSNSFITNTNMDGLNYEIVQKPKCWNGDEENPVFGEVTEVSGLFECEDGFQILPVLCPYLSKNEITEDGTDNGGENDSAGIPAFHGLPGTWTPTTSTSTLVSGKLIKSGADFADIWNVDLKVPCFTGNCGQDWAGFVESINPLANPNDYIQPLTNEHKLFGCDLWLQVTAKTPPIGCDEKIDLMLVLDRSTSINSGELSTLKDAAKAFVDAIAPAPDESHVGMSSFATGATLNQHLTAIGADVKTAIDALVASGLTNLAGGINLATGELDDAHEHERPAISDVMVIITDGAPNIPSPAATAQALAATAADNARDAGIEIFVVGVGVSVATETYLITEIANSEAHYFAAVDFNDLGAILQELASCP